METDGDRWSRARVSGVRARVGVRLRVRLSALGSESGLGSGSGLGLGSESGLIKARVRQQAHT